ncbi:hypothetical protein EYF80_068181 [Liparis tanakae]|uniref:Uncharacterized protein n=1 Tax=Liparis tanakae TaxID=230148 RepID=A0A4Z2DZ45_9TELE|nr:hypothetical protein EYF80_068181 [Liparis tanakae]
MVRAVPEGIVRKLNTENLSLFTEGTPTRLELRYITEYIKEYITEYIKEYITEYITEYIK